MDTATLLTTLLFLSGAVNRIVEALKPGLSNLPFVNEENLPAFTLLLSLLIGIIAVVGGGAQLNLLAVSEVYGRINPWAGLVLTGLIVGGGANFLHLIYELLTRTPAPGTSQARVVVASEGEIEVEAGSFREEHAAG